MNLTEKYKIKATQFYNSLMDCNSMSMEEALEALKKTSAGVDRDGMTSDAIKFFVQHGLAYRSENRLRFIEVKNHREKITKLAQELAEHTVAQFSKPKKIKSNKQDVVQPTLFTESVMRERDQPIVTASDQLNDRINALESKLNTIITFFKTL
jgi:hypothetical protein